MRIQTFSLVVGTRACNARCPFCVSRMTGFDEVPRGRGINERNLAKAVAAAREGGTTTVLMSGKGEPTLYPDEITRYLELLGQSFPFVELQTNGLAIGRLARDGRSRIPGLERGTLTRWWELGLDTVALSVVGVRGEQNARVYDDDYPDLAGTVGLLHETGFTVRLCVMMQREMVDRPEAVDEVIDFCRRHEVEQLTVRPIRKPSVASKNQDAADYVTRHGLEPAEVDAIAAWIDERGEQLLTLLHGARIYDVDGQNVCLSDCLTVDASSDDIRTLIFYGDGRITYDWQYDGAILVAGRQPPA